MKIRTKAKPSRILANPKHNRNAGQHGAHTLLEDVTIPAFADVPERNEGHLILYAMNGTALVRLDLGVPEHGDEPGPIPAPALKHMERGVSAALNESEVRVGITRYDRVASEVNPGSNHGWPDPGVLLEKIKPPPAKRKLVLLLDPKLVANLAAAMDAEDGVHLILDADNLQQMTAPGREDERWYTGAIRVEGRRDVGSLGVLMPMRPIGA